MRNLLIELLSEKIVDVRSKEYFREVISSFQNENYRSSVVMLYSVVICDLLFKINTLHEVYGDSKAESIIKLVKKLQKENQKSSDWESKLIDAVKERTDFLEIHEYADIMYLQQQRHLSAHPVLVSDVKLFSPNKDGVRAHIRNMLEAVLTKPAIFSKNIFHQIVQDVAQVKDNLLSDDQLDKYLSSKYLDGLGDVLYNDIFKRFWKVTFVTRNDDCNRNRDINLRVIRLIFTKRSENIVKFTADNSNAFIMNNIHDNRFGKNSLFDYLYIFLFYSGYKFFKALPESVRILVEQSSKDEGGYYNVFNVFQFPELDLVKLNITKSIESNSNPSWELLKDLEFTKFLNENFGLEFRREFCLRVYSNSRSYDHAKNYQRILIAPYISTMPLSDLKQVVSIINTNDQIHQLNGNLGFKYNLRKRIDELSNETFNYDLYPNF